MLCDCEDVTNINDVLSFFGCKVELPVNFVYADESWRNNYDYFESFRRKVISSEKNIFTIVNAKHVFQIGSFI